MDGPSATSQPIAAEPVETQMIQDEDEDEELQRALALSMASEAVDPEFVNQLLGNSDMSDPLIQAALEQLKSNQSEEGEEKEEKSKKRKSDDI